MPTRMHAMACRSSIEQLHEQQRESECIRTGVVSMQASRSTSCSRCTQWKVRKNAFAAPSLTPTRFPRCSHHAVRAGTLASGLLGLANNVTPRRCCLLGRRSGSAQLCRRPFLPCTRREISKRGYLLYVPVCNRSKHPSEEFGG